MHFHEFIDALLRDRSCDLELHCISQLNATIVREYVTMVDKMNWVGVENRHSRGGYVDCLVFSAGQIYLQFFNFALKIHNFTSQIC